MSLVLDFVCWALSYGFVAVVSDVVYEVVEFLEISAMSVTDVQYGL